MDERVYRACSDELEKIARGVPFTAPRLKLFKTKLKSHIVKSRKVSEAVTQKPAIRTVWQQSPESGVSNLGSAHGIKPPVVRL